MNLLTVLTTISTFLAETGATAGDGLKYIGAAFAVFTVLLLHLLKVKLHVMH